MLLTTNNTITVQRWLEVSGESSFTNLTTGLSCYIEPAEFDVAINIDWQSTSDVFNLLSSDVNIIIWDKIIDKDLIEYKVKGTKVFNDMLWKHIECTILKEYWE